MEEEKSNVAKIADLIRVLADLRLDTKSQEYEAASEEFAKQILKLTK